VVLALIAGDAYTKCMQYTIRSIPPAIDEAVRERARAEGKSLNEVAVEALADGLGLGDEDVVRRDLSDVVGTWKKDVAVEAALAAQDRVDPDLWK
jgi:hypothetical protein